LPTEKFRIAGGFCVSFQAFSARCSRTFIRSRGFKRAGFGRFAHLSGKAKRRERTERILEAGNSAGSLAISHCPPDFAPRAAIPANLLKTKGQFFSKTCDYRPRHSAHCANPSLIDRRNFLDLK
jgi:hypothetical protein